MQRCAGMPCASKTPFFPNKLFDLQIILGIGYYARVRYARVPFIRC